MTERVPAPRGMHAWLSPNGEEIVIGDGDTIDDIQKSGRFIVSSDSVEVKQ